MKKQISTLFGSPSSPYKAAPTYHQEEISRLTRAPKAPPSFMFPRTSPKSIDDFELGMEDIRLDQFLDDELPSPDEVKAYGLTPRTPLTKRRWFRRACIGGLLSISFILLVVVFVSRKPSQHDASVSTNDNTSQLSEDLILVDSRLHDTISFLLDDVDHKDLTNTSSPQFLAARWMADVDGLRAPLTQDSGFKERYALVVLWFATWGADWSNSLDFLTEAHHCEWRSTFQRSDMQVYEMGVECNELAEVQSLILRKYTWRCSSFLAILEFKSHRCLHQQKP